MSEVRLLCDTDRDDWPELEPLTEAEIDELEEAFRLGWPEAHMRRTGDDRP